MSFCCAPRLLMALRKSSFGRIFGKVLLPFDPAAGLILLGKKAPWTESLLPQKGSKKPGKGPSAQDGKPLIVPQARGGKQRSFRVFRQSGEVSAPLQR